MEVDGRLILKFLPVLKRPLIWQNQYTIWKLHLTSLSPNVVLIMLQLLYCSVLAVKVAYIVTSIVTKLLSSKILEIIRPIHLQHPDCFCLLNKALFGRADRTKGLQYPLSQFAFNNMAHYWRGHNVVQRTVDWLFDPLEPGTTRSGGCTAPTHRLRTPINNWAVRISSQFPRSRSLKIALLGVKANLHPTDKTETPVDCNYTVTV